MVIILNFMIFMIIALGIILIYASVSEGVKDEIAENLKVYHPNLPETVLQREVKETTSTYGAQGLMMVLVGVGIVVARAFS